MRKPSRILIGLILGLFLLISFACNFPVADALLLMRQDSPTRTPRATKIPGARALPHPRP